MDSKKAIPAARSFLSFNRLKMANMSHKYITVMHDIIAPMDNTALTFTRVLNTYKYGMTKMLNDAKLPTRVCEEKSVNIDLL